MEKFYKCICRQCTPYFTGIQRKCTNYTKCGNKTGPNREYHCYSCYDNNTVYVCCICRNNICSNKEEMIKKVSENGHLLRFAPKELKNDKEIIFNAINNNPCAMRFVPIETLDNEIVLYFLSKIRNPKYFSRSFLPKYYFGKDYISSIHGLELYLEENITSRTPTLNHNNMNNVNIIYIIIIAWW